jgi:hypothetical protein
MAPKYYLMSPMFHNWALDMIVQSPTYNTPLIVASQLFGFFESTRPNN